MTHSTITHSVLFTSHSDAGARGSVGFTGVLRLPMAYVSLCSLAVTAVTCPHQRGIDLPPEIEAAPPSQTPSHKSRWVQISTWKLPPGLCCDLPVAGSFLLHICTPGNESSCLGLGKLTPPLSLYGTLIFTTPRPDGSYPPSI